jgi:hypothetical protein
VDLSVDPAREQEKLHNFHAVFRPAAIKQPGFVDVKMLKLRSALTGAAPGGANSLRTYLRERRTTTSLGFEHHSQTALVYYRKDTHVERLRGSSLR